MFTEAAQICQDIIDGKYGQYALETDWTNIFGFDNERCPELIWSVPSQNAKTETDAMYWGMMVPYNYKNYLGGLEGSGSMIRISVSNLMYMKAMANIAVCLLWVNW